jgi:hypothetical protein
MKLQTTTRAVKGERVRCVLIDRRILLTVLSRGLDVEVPVGSATPDVLRPQCEALGAVWSANA